MLSILVVALAAAQVNLPGTQPNELTSPPEPSSSCNCHLAFSQATFTEPGQTYRSTVMALSARDPLFLAALKMAHEARPEASDLCIRCHAPAAWLGGRSTPGDGSLLTEEDRESVTCDMCHRQVPSVERPELIGSGQFTLDQDTKKRARRGIAPKNGHQVEQSDFIGSSELCGKCHSLFNPLETGHDANGNSYADVYFEQRTYEEWRDSAYAARGESCVSCHMKKVQGRAARQGLEEHPDLAQHLIVGGNDWIPRAVLRFDPNTPYEEEDLPYVLEAIEESLRDAALLEVTNATTTAPIEAVGREEIELDVRLTNRTGHKLPSGYPEGRRVYLEVELELAGTSSIVSGFWDPETAMLRRDPQLRTYETEHGRHAMGVSTRIHELIEMNQILSDTRIPPEGFAPTEPDMIPQGRDYGANAPYRHWDEHSYRIAIPDVAEVSTGTITVRARYMITDGEVVNFLLDGAGRDSPEGMDLLRAWETFDRVPPRSMSEVKIPLRVEPAPSAPDAGVSGDAAVDGGAPIDPGPMDSGCSCDATTQSSQSSLFFIFALAFFFAIRKRVR